MSKEVESNVIFSKVFNSLVYGELQTKGKKYTIREVTDLSNGIHKNDMSILCIDKGFACIHTSYELGTMPDLVCEVKTDKLQAVKIKIPYCRAEELLTMLGYLLEDCKEFEITELSDDGTTTNIRKVYQSYFSNRNDWNVSIYSSCEDYSE